jgi:hypothetical protein
MKRPRSRTAATLLLGLGALGLGLFGTPKTADARCSSHYVRILQHGGVPSNGRMIVEGAIVSAAWVGAMQQPELVSGNERIPLSVVEPHVFKNTGRDFAQVVLVPQKALTQGKTYRLAVKNAAAEDRETLAHASFHAAGADAQAPVWTAAPKLMGTNHTQLGCGPSTSASISVDATDDGQPVTLYRVNFKERGATTAVNFYVQAEQGTLHVGRGMCGGPVEPVPGKAYEITVTAVDAAGNATPAPGGPLLAQF